MPIIDPAGLFSGKRLRRCSDGARVRWPYYFVASNGFARLELDPETVLAEAFLDFKEPVSIDLFWLDMEEYRNNFLLFSYEDHHGRVWGQWDCQPKWLNKYKTKADSESPAPLDSDLEEWRKQYQQLREVPLSFRKFSKVYPNLPLGEGVGVGVGAGAGVVEAAAAPGKNPATESAGTSGPCERRDETPCTDLDTLVRSLASDLAEAHAAFTPGSLAAAELNIKHVLSRAADPEAVATAIRASHALFCAHWTDKRRQNSRVFVPNLAKWIADRDYLHPPRRRGIVARQEEPVYKCGACFDLGEECVIEGDIVVDSKPCSKCGGKAAA